MSQQQMKLYMEHFTKDILEFININLGLVVPNHFYLQMLCNDWCNESDKCEEYRNLNHITFWDLSLIDNLSHLFSNKKFNELLLWNVTNVVIMNGTFNSCTRFNKPLNHWKTSKVTTINHLFTGCKNFDQPLDNWDVSKVETMFGTFEGCNYFNQPLDNWDVSNVTNMSYLFKYCSKFNQPLNTWNIDNVRIMKEMFKGCMEFNQPLDKWKITKSQILQKMFEDCIKLDINSFDDWELSVILPEKVEKMFQNSLIERQNKIPQWYKQIEVQCGA